MIYVLGIFALIGHFSIFVAIINRIHALHLPYRLMKACNYAWYALCIGVPILVGSRLGDALVVEPGGTYYSVPWLAGSYAGICCAATVIAILTIVSGRRLALTSSLLTANHTQIVDVSETTDARLTGDPRTWFCSKIPGNEILHLSIHEKSLALPRLSPRLEGLSICHLSDLHFTGQLKPAFFHQVVRQANLLECDVVIISGDIVDKPECISWVPEILGKLNSRYGCYYVLGNHDKRVKKDAAIHGALDEAGLINLSSRWRIVEINGEQILLAGNELPWYPAADLNDCPSGDYLRVTVSHSPDQIQWACSHDMDLFLAGHTHGGQFRLPVIGPVLSPSLHGVKYAAGTFYEEPTLIHVSRGISGTRPLRFACPPELAKLVLHRSSDAS